MINYHKDLVAALKRTGIPVHYELMLHEGLKTPCISYIETNNAAAATGDTLGYSSLQYQIKIWGTDLSVLQDYALKIDDVLRPLGWSRISCRELYDKESAMIQKVMTYEANASEIFN